MAPRRKLRNHRLLRFITAVFSVVMAFGLTLWFLPWLYPAVTPLFFVAVMASAWLGGWQTGLLSSILSTLVIRFFFIEPLNFFNANMATVVQLGTFLIAVGIINWRHQPWRFYSNKNNKNRTSVRQKSVIFDIERASTEVAVAEDLQDTQLLRELGVQLVREDDIQTMYQKTISVAIALTRAKAGTVQILDAADLIAQRQTTGHAGEIGYVEDLDQQQAIAAGFQMRVAKPVDPNALV